MKHSKNIFLLLPMFVNFLRAMEQTNASDISWLCVQEVKQATAETYPLKKKIPQQYAEVIQTTETKTIAPEGEKVTFIVDLPTDDSTDSPIKKLIRQFADSTYKNYSTAVIFKDPEVTCILYRMYEETWITTAFSTVVAFNSFCLKKSGLVKDELARLCVNYYIKAVHRQTLNTLLTKEQASIKIILDENKEKEVIKKIINPLLITMQPDDNRAIYLFDDGEKKCHIQMPGLTPPCFPTLSLQFKNFKEFYNTHNMGI